MNGVLSIFLLCNAHTHTRTHAHYSDRFRCNTSWSQDSGRRLWLLLRRTNHRKPFPTFHCRILPGVLRWTHYFRPGELLYLHEHERVESNVESNSTSVLKSWIGSFCDIDWCWLDTSACKQSVCMPISSLQSTSVSPPNRLARIAPPPWIRHWKQYMLMTWLITKRCS